MSKKRAHPSTSPTPRPPARTNGGGRGMLWTLAAICAAGLLGWGALSIAQNDALGKVAMQHTTKVTELGPRPSGSVAHKQMQDYIIATLKSAGAAVETDSFTAATPNGPIPMTNIIGRIPGRSAGAGSGNGARIFVVASHYDTKVEEDFRFVGANDGGSSTGLLLALAPLLARKSFHHEVRLVFFDGEEAIREWTREDSLYGSRHLAARWQNDGTAKRIGAFILLDMIGDSNLVVNKEASSTGWLQEQIWTSARSLGYERHFDNNPLAVEDDHLPFLDIGVPAVDLIDFSYGPGNSYWHTAQDTLDKVSPRSMQIVGEVVLDALTTLDLKK